MGKIGVYGRNNGSASVAAKTSISNINIMARIFRAHGSGGSIISDVA